jgi:hypothetical protein
VFSKIGKTNDLFPENSAKIRTLTLMIATEWYNKSLPISTEDGGSSRRAVQHTSVAAAQSAGERKWRFQRVRISTLARNSQLFNPRSRNRRGSRRARGLAIHSSFKAAQPRPKASVNVLGRGDQNSPSEPQPQANLRNEYCTGPSDVRKRSSIDDRSPARCRRPFHKAPKSFDGVWRAGRGC